MTDQALLSDKQNPFLWQSEELECVESWLGVLLCRSGDNDGGAVTTERHGRARPKDKRRAAAACPSRKEAARR